MKLYPLTSLHEFLGDRVVFRNLQPADLSLPNFNQIASAIDLPAGRVPRKNDLDYARVIVKLLHTTQAQRGLKAPINRLVFLGDTQLLDGTAFTNLCQVGGWPGLAFIGSENDQPPDVQITTPQKNIAIYSANRWAALNDFAAYVEAQGFSFPETTAVVVDIDKTALGARGRNAQVIDRARVQAVQDTVAAILADSFDESAFRNAYQVLNQPEFHPFTEDNQDYVAYTCLMLGSNLFTLESFVKKFRLGEISSFREFISTVDARRSGLTNPLEVIHDEIYAYVQAGDPTPFKVFRRNEYLRTIRLFNALPESASLDQRIDRELLITQEVRQVARFWQEQGALLFGLSDKPDEAAIPSTELAAAGYQTIHRACTHALGEDVSVFPSKGV